MAARYNASGPAALGDQRRRNGRAASLLREDVLAALAERLRTPPEDGGLWSGPKVAAWMAGQLGLERVHPQRGWEALKRAWFKTCHFQVTAEIDRALMVKGFFGLGVTLT